MNFEKNTFTEYARAPMGNVPNLQYTEAIPTQNWEIRDDTLTISGFLCQKATCTFSGRDFMAWFAHDIPISNGPWKFGGLPGLILMVYDENKIYQFECIKIENCKQKYPIKIYDYVNYKKTERKELLELQKELHENYHKTAGVTPGEFINGEFVESNRPQPRLKYDPLELE